MVCFVALQTATLNVLKYTLRASLLARLASGAFYDVAKLCRQFKG
jgi:hypothetical protein